MYLLPLRLLQTLQSVSWLRLAKSCSISNKKNIHQYLTKRKLSQLSSSIFSKSFKQKEHSDLPPPRQACFFQQISFLKPIIIMRDNPPSSRLLGFDKIYPHPFFFGTSGPDGHPIVSITAVHPPPALLPSYDSSFHLIGENSK